MTNPGSSTSPNVNLCSTQWEDATETSSIPMCHSITNPGQCQPMAYTPYACQPINSQAFHPQDYVVPCVHPMTPYTSSHMFGPSIPPVYQLPTTRNLYSHSFPFMPI